MMSIFVKKLQSNKPPLHTILLILTMCYFLVFAIIMAHLGGQPDSEHHSYIAGRFSSSWGIPEENMCNYYLITGQPYLYYWIIGAITKVTQWILPPEVVAPEMIWRLSSVAMSLLTTFYLYKIITKITNNPYAGVLGVFFLSNTMMFTFLAGGVNYDNLMNLASIAAIYHLVNIYNGEDFIQNTSLMGICLCIAALAKKQSLLLALILFLVWGFYLLKRFKRIEFTLNRGAIPKILLFLIMLGLLFGLYAVNFLNYNKLTPSCQQIKSKEVCTRFIDRIDDEVPVSFSWMWSIRNTFINNPFQYLFSFWFFHMLRSIWGVVSGNTYVPMITVSLHGILIIWGLLCLARYWNKTLLFQNMLIFILAAYLIYVFSFNYSYELRYDFKYYANQGRYLFPVIGAFYALLIDVFLKIRSTTIKRLTIALSIIIYYAGGFGVFLFRYAEVFAHWRVYF